MATASEPRAAVRSPNIQDAFLNHARRDRAAPCASACMDGTEFDGRIKNFDRFAVIVEHDGADQMIFKHAIATHHAARSVGNYYSPPDPQCTAPPCHFRSPAPSSSSSTASASASCRMPPTYGDEGSNTLGNIARRVPLHDADAARARPRAASRRSAARRRRNAPAAAFGRMAERSPGKDSVTGHWELMGLVARPPVPGVSRTAFRRELIARVRARASAARTLGNVVASGTRDHRRARARAPARPGARSSTRRPTACSRSPRTRTSIPVAELYRHLRDRVRAWSVEGLGVGRVIARPFVGAPGTFTRTANRRDFAMPPARRHAARPGEGRGPPGRRHRQDRGPVRRAAASPRPCTPTVGRRGHGRSRAGRCARSSAG